MTRAGFSPRPPNAFGRSRSVLKPGYAEPATVIPSEDFMILRVTTVHENGCPRIVGAARFGRQIPANKAQDKLFECPWICRDGVDKVNSQE